MFLETGKKLKIKDIHEVEEKLNIKLPKQLVKHYLKYNGGIPDKTFFYSDASEVETNVRTFLPMKYRDEADLTLEELYLDLKNRGVIPSNYLPFALDYGDNIFCVNLDNRQVVIIYLDESDVITEDEIDFLTNDFKEFLNSLEDEDD